MPIVLVTFQKIHLDTSYICLLAPFLQQCLKFVLSVLSHGRQGNHDQSFTFIHLSLSWNHIKRFTSQKSSTLTFGPATVWQSLNGQTHKNESHLSDKNAIHHFAFLQGNICQEPSWAACLHGPDNINSLVEDKNN